MKEVYLTKVERKTIFTKSLIYVLIMFIISDLTQTGPFYINFIPWLYILGILASVKSIDKILTCIIGGFTVFVSCIIVQGGLNFVVLTHTLAGLIELIFGIVTGKIFYEFILEHRLVKYIRKSKKTLYIAVIVALSVICIGINSILYGDIYSYLVSKKNLDQYISKTYMVEDYNIKETVYNKSVIGDYVYKVQIDESLLYLVPVTKTEFKELNRQDRINKMQDDLNSTYGKVISNIYNSENFIEVDMTDISFKLDYSKACVNPDMVIMAFDVETQNITSASNEIALIIEKVQALNCKITDVVINMNDKMLNIKLDENTKVTEEYISKGLSIEDLDK